MLKKKLRLFQSVNFTQKNS